MLAKNILRIKKGPWQILKENEQNGARGSGKQSPAKNIKWESRVCIPTIVLQAIVLEVAHVLGCYTLSLEIPCLLNLLTPALTSIDLLRMRADWKVLWQDFI